MADLLFKELKMRGLVERVLIIVPAALTIQWQDELPVLRRVLRRHQRRQR
jgi:N12 class adenine-specific DNA methylase